MDAVASIWQAATPLVLAAMAGVLASRAGIWHLGLGGIMSIGAMVSVLVARESGSIALALLFAMLSTLPLSFLMWLTIERLKANSIIVGIGINSIGVGGTILAIVAIDGREGTVSSGIELPKPFAALGGQVGQLSIVALATPVIVVAVWWLVTRTRFGLRLSACGDHPFAARSVGISIPRVRLVALLAGGILCGLSGSELALGSLGSFTPGLEAGRGLIAFAAVILAAGNPLAATVSAVFFGAVGYLGIWIQLNWFGSVPSELLLTLPYLATIVAVVLAARIRKGSAINPAEMRE